MTNSPPSKVNFVDTDSSKVLCSGIDSLYLTIDLKWENNEFFSKLTKAKEQAHIKGEEEPIELKTWDDEIITYFNILSHGSKGYEWIIKNNEYLIKIGNWLEPSSRPSVFIEIRSETLHKYGTNRAVEIILLLLIYVKATIITVRINRVDLYCDILLPEECWSESLKEFLVSRANKRSWHNEGKIFSGFSIGKGAIMARLYDKPLEIKQKSNKNWMYDIWGIEKVPAAFKVIRVEFQLRREKVKEYSINTFDDLIDLSPNLWAYCTKEWLKLQDKPGTHHTQRRTFQWWKTVQSAYHGSQDANPLVSMEAASQNNGQILRQLIGNVTSMVAINSKGNMPTKESIGLWSFWILQAFPNAGKYGAMPKDLENKIKNKMAKHSRSTDAFAQINGERIFDDIVLKRYYKDQLEKERKEFNKKKLWE